MEASDKALLDEIVKRIEGKLELHYSAIKSVDDTVSKLLAQVSVFRNCVENDIPDHEDRIRILEGSRNWLMGVAAAIGAIIAFFVRMLFPKIGG